MNIGKAIQSARKKAGITQAELGKILGVSGSMIGQWENSLRKPKPESIGKIADALDISIYELVPEIDNEFSRYLYFEGFAESQYELKEEGYTFSDDEIMLVKNFNQLNKNGQKRAGDYIKDLTQIPDYTKKNPDQQTE